MKLVTKRDLWTIAGFLLFVFGFTALTMSLVGVKWSFLSWMDQISPLVGLMGKLGMIILGLIIVVLAQMHTNRANNP